MEKPLQRILESEQGAYVTINKTEYLNLCSNNYLGLASDPRVKAAAIKAIEEYGVGTTSVRSLVGTHLLHLQLEKELAQFKKTEDALVLTGGYITNLAVMQTLVGKEDIVLSDAGNHASIIDAIKLSQSQHRFIYNHNDIEHLRTIIPAVNELKRTKRLDGQDRVIVIISDGVFSMDGDVALLPDLTAIATELEAILIIDDAHGEGVMGDHGRGLVDYFGMHGQVDIEVGTLSKAFGVMGGFIAGDTEVVEKFRTKARQYMFTNALSIPDTAALIESVKIVAESDERVQKLWDNTKTLKDGLATAGFNIGNSVTPITPLMIGSEEKAKAMADELLSARILTSAIVYPMVAKGQARLRLMPSALHTTEDLKNAVEILIKIGKKYVQ